MITSAISSAARLSLAPARLAGRMAGSLLRGLRGNDSGEASSARSSARTTPAPRSRARTQTKRATTRSSAKAQPKRTAPRTRPKGQPSAAGSKRTAARARPKSQPSAARAKRTAASAPAQARPKPTAGPEPLSDVAIAREVELTIFRDVEVHRGQVDVKVAEGVVRLRGEVRTPDLINELEARAVQVPQVRRVENLLRTPAPPPETPTPASKQMDPASTLEKSSRPPSPASALRTTNLAAGAQAPGAESASGAAEARAGRPERQAEPPTGAPAGAPEPAAGRPEGDESDHDKSRLAELDKDPTYQPRDQRTHGLKGS
jgi:osmotically-inducible protein OsmY